MLSELSRFWKLENPLPEHYFGIYELDFFVAGKTVFSDLSAKAASNLATVSIDANKNYLLIKQFVMSDTTGLVPPNNNCWLVDLLLLLLLSTQSTSHSVLQSPNRKVSLSPSLQQWMILFCQWHCMNTTSCTTTTATHSIPGSPHEFIVHFFPCTTTMIRTSKIVSTVPGYLLTTRFHRWFIGSG